MATVNNLAAAPSVPAILANDPTGLLDATQIKAGIVVQIPNRGDNPLPFDEKVWLFWAPADDPDNELELTEHFVPPGTQFPLEVTVPVARYLQGPLRLRYTGLNGAGNPFSSEITPIVVDTIPPYGNDSPESLIVPPGADVIDDAYLEAHDGKVVLTVPTGYPGQSADDVVLFFWMNEIPGNPETFPPPSVPPFTIGQGTAIVLDRPLLEAVGNGQCFGIYLLRDKAGNVSRLSWWITATVALAPAARGA